MRRMMVLEREVHYAIGTLESRRTFKDFNALAVASVVFCGLVISDTPVVVIRYSESASWLAPRLARRTTGVQCRCLTLRIYGWIGELLRRKAHA